jgi:large subunit ribosomal protein L10
VIKRLLHLQQRRFFILHREEECHLPITRSKKAELIDKYKEQLAKAPAVVFTNYKGASVAQVNVLRAKLKDSGTTFMVVKNGLLGIAFEQLGRPSPDALLAGPNAVAFLGEDIGKAVTALKDGLREAKIMEITGAVLESSVLDAKQAESLSDLPTKDQTRAMVLGAISAPSGSLVRMISGPGASLVRVLNAYVEKNKEAKAA